MMQTLMRKMGYLAMVVGLAAVSTVQAAGAGADDAGNYGAGAFTNGSNLGSGFGAWEFNVGDGALVDLADSTSGTGNINSTNGVSFRFYGGSSGSYGEATRAFNAALAQGDIFSATIAYNWGGGARGINILDASNNELLNINFSDDNLSYTFSGALGVVVSSTYSDTASVSVVVGQLAGKYRQGFGTPFDLAVLRQHPLVQRGDLDLQRVTHVRIVDVGGDGRVSDAFGRPIFAPFPSVGSAGFDLDAVASLRGRRGGGGE